MSLTLLYIDPGIGSYIVQGIIAGILGVLFYFKTGWSRIKMFFKGKKGNSEKNKS